MSHVWSGVMQPCTQARPHTRTHSPPLPGQGFKPIREELGVINNLIMWDRSRTNKQRFNPRPGPLTPAVA